MKTTKASLKQIKSADEDLSTPSERPPLPVQRSDIGEQNGHRIKHSIAHMLFKGIFGDWYTHEDPSSKDRMRFLITNYTTNIRENLMGGSFLTGLLLITGAGDDFIATLTLIDYVVNLLQVFMSLILEQYKHRKRLILVLRTISVIINVLIIGLIPLAPVESQTKLSLFAVCKAVCGLGNALMNPAISIWQLQCLPQSIQPGFFSTLATTLTPIVALANLLGGAIVDGFKANGNEYMGLLVLRLIGLLLYALEFMLYLHIKEPPYENTSEKFRLRDLIMLPLKNRVYMHSIWALCMWTLATALCGSYYTVYLLKNLQVSYTYITTINFINVPVIFLLTPLWNRFFQNCSPFRMLWISILLNIPSYIGMAFVSQSTLLLYPIAMIWGFISLAGCRLGTARIPYVNMPQDHQTAFIGIYQTLNYLSAMLGVSLGKRFILATEELNVNLCGIEMCNKQYLMLIVAAVSFLAATLIFFIDRTTPCEK